MKMFQAGKLLLMIGLIFALTACGGGGGTTEGNQDGGSSTPVDPANAAALSAALVIPGSTVVQGQLPAPSTSSTRPEVIRSEESLSYSPGSQITLPTDYQASSGTLSTALVAVSGSNSYFEVPLQGAGTSGTFVLPVNLPAQVQDGKFCLDVMLVDSAGQTGDLQKVCVSVVQPLTCDTKRISGGEGLTSTIHEMGGNAGTVRVQYETFTVKDKIDIFQNGTWVAGTGPMTDRTSIRTALDCSVATEDLGYVGQNSEFLFNYDPTVGGNIEVVVSGCENNGTAWNYTASCPGVYPVGTVGTLTLSSPFSSLSSQSYVYDTTDSEPTNHIWRVGSGQAQVAAAQMEIYNAPGSESELLHFFVYEGTGLSGLWVYVGDSGSCILSGTDLYDYYPLCSSWGITVNRSAGTISFESTPVLDKTDGTTTGTMSGSLTFTPF